MSEQPLAGSGEDNLVAPELVEQSEGAPGAAGQGRTGDPNDWFEREGGTPAADEDIAVDGGDDSAAAGRSS